MYRAAKMGRELYSRKIDDFKQDIENIQTFVDEGAIVILGDDLSEIANLLNVELDEITQ